jgi:hypothetical protein
MPQNPISQLAIQSSFSPNQEARKALFKSSSYIYIHTHQSNVISSFYL